MTQPLDEMYLAWLYRQFANPNVASPSKTYWNIANLLYTKEYVWIIPNDDNRAEDGRYLRYEFADDLGLDDVDPHWMGLGCSMLELFVGLSRRLAFQGEGEPREWFWELMDNLDIYINDRQTLPVDEVHEKLDRVIWRTYKRNGSGGLFPLKNPDRDQRDVELWHQLNAYLVERF